MIVQNSPELQALLKSWPSLQKQSMFVIDDKEFHKHYKECEKQHPEESLEFRHLRAIRRCLTIDSKAIAVENAVQHHHYSHDGWFKWVVLALLVLLILLVASQRAHAQNVTPAIAVTTCGTQTLTAGQPTHLTVNLTGAECTSAASGIATVVLGTTTGTGVIGTVLQGSPPWTIDLTRVNGQTAATNGAGVLAVAGATSPGLIIQGQGNGGTPVTVSWVTATPSVSISTVTAVGTPGQPVVTLGTTTGGVAAGVIGTVNVQAAGVGLAVLGAAQTGAIVSQTAPVYVGGYGGAAGLFPIITCDNSPTGVGAAGPGLPAGFYGNTSGNAQIIAAPSAGRHIVVCAWGVTAFGTATTVKFVSGTGTNCGTGPTDVTGSYSLPINGQFQQGSGLGMLWSLPAAKALCINNSGANFIGGTLTYTAFWILLLPGSFLYSRWRNIIRNILFICGLFAAASSAWAQVGPVTVNSLSTSAGIVTVTTATTHNIAANQGFCLSSAPLCGVSLTAPTATTLTFSGNQTCSSSCGTIQAAKQIIILGATRVSSTSFVLKVLFWLASSQPQPLSPSAKSAWSGASLEENQAVVSGLFYEQPQEFTLPLPFSIPNIKTQLQAQYDAAQASLAASIQPGRFFGVYFNGAWSQ